MVKTKQNFNYFGYGVVKRINKQDIYVHLYLYLYL